MRIMYGNLFDNYDLTESGEDENYPVENTQDIRLAKKWRTEDAGSASIIIDAGVGLTLTCNCCAVLAHNFEASAETYIQAHATSSWGDPSLNTLVTYRSDIMILFFDSTTKRYWRFYFDDTTNSLGYYEVGRLFLGNYLQVDPSSMVEFPEKHPRSDRLTFSITNQMFSDIGLEHKELSYRFEHASTTAKTAVEIMWGSVGMYKPWIMLNYNLDYTVIEPIYCTITEPIIFEHLKFDKWNYALELRECD